MSDPQTTISVGLGSNRSRIDVDPADLSPRARALAQVWASAPLGWRSHIVLESTRTLREMGATEDDAIFYGADALDRRHRISWQHWPAWPEKQMPGDGTKIYDRADTPAGVIRSGGLRPDGTWRLSIRATIAEYLEECAARLPMGYIPVGLDCDDRVPAADDPAVAAAADLLTKTQVLELLRTLGRPISGATLDNYRSRPAVGWPQPVDYVGRTPRWSRSDIEEYAAAAGGVAVARVTS